jgi:hypothetical protein
MMICDRCGAPVDLNEATIVPATTEVAARYRHSICHLNTVSFQPPAPPTSPTPFEHWARSAA